MAMRFVRSDAVVRCKLSLFHQSRVTAFLDWSFWFLVTSWMWSAGARSKIFGTSPRIKCAWYVFPVETTSWNIYRVGINTNLCCFDTNAVASLSVSTTTKVTTVFPLSNSLSIELYIMVDELLLPTSLVSTVGGIPHRNPLWFLLGYHSNLINVHYTLRNWLCSQEHSISARSIPTHVHSLCPPCPYLNGPMGNILPAPY